MSEIRLLLATIARRIKLSLQLGVVVQMTLRVTLHPVVADEVSLPMKVHCR
jgi:hypothetical protein